MTLGERLRGLRGSASLKDIATATGLSVSYLSDLERDRTEPALRTLVRLADAYHMRVIALLAPVELGENAASEPLPFDC